MSIFHKIREFCDDTTYIWWQEIKQVVHDDGVFLFVIVVPLIYPLLYSWIYNNDAVHEVPVVVVDQSHSELSRQFIRDCDASPDVKVAFYAKNLDEAKSLVSRQLVKGVYYIPVDFALRIARMEQAAVSVYCDMSLMLTYKAIYQTAMLESQRMGASIRVKLAGNYTSHDDAVSVQPLKVNDVAMFNPSGGYGSCILPAVLMLILQQTLALGIGMSAGTARERNRNGQLIPDDDKRYRGVYRVVSGKALCYAMIYTMMGAYLSMVIPRLFSFPALAGGMELMYILLPYILACVFFGMTVSCMVRYRENVMLIMVFVSVPLLFLSGVSWPQSSMPGFWQGVSWLFPSTFGIRAYVKVNSMGANINQVIPELRILWLHAALYFAAACLVYQHQFRLAKRYGSNA